MNTNVEKWKNRKLRDQLAYEVDRQNRDVEVHAAIKLKHGRRERYRTVLPPFHPEPE
jgi:hypothetical protein